jgi:hypothetical protein
MLEFYFPSEMEDRNPAPIHLRRWQCNRLPGWKPGDRCWILDIYGCDLLSKKIMVVYSGTVFWREGRIPSRVPWEGPRQDGKADPPPPPQRTPEEAQAYMEHLQRFFAPAPPKPAKKRSRKKIDVVEELRKRHGMGPGQ